MTELAARYLSKPQPWMSNTRLTYLHPPVLCSDCSEKMSVKVCCISSFGFSALSIVNKQNGPTKHVALVGVTGVGKSTIVNVLTGSNRANVTNDVTPCTVRPDRYDIEEEGINYTLWDTRGLNEATEQEATGPIARFLRLLRVVPDADHDLRKFLRGKNPKIHLIVFCIEAKKIRVDAQWKNYDKIYAKFCKRRIKVAVVVTRLDWNIRNTDWKATCEGMAREVVGESLDARLVEAVPTFERLEDTRDCRSKILRLVSNFS